VDYHRGRRRGEIEREDGDCCERESGEIPPTFGLGYRGDDFGSGDREVCHDDSAG
jgi:hypothetical protein